MQKKIAGALISVFYKDGLEPIVKSLDQLGIKIYTTGGTQKFIEGLGIKCIPVESLTSYPSILGGRVKTLHPIIFGGILGRRDMEQDISEMAQYKIPEIDLVIVDLYPFEETVTQFASPLFSGDSSTVEKSIIEKIDIGGPSMIRAAAKNFKDVLVVAAKEDYQSLVELLQAQKGESTLEQRKQYAAKAFDIVMNYDIAISNYFNPSLFNPYHKKQSLRYGENPHQQAMFYGDLSEVFTQLHGKEISYNNLVDIDAAIQLISEFPKSFSSNPTQKTDPVFAVIKHTNVCGVAQRTSVKESWDAALQCDPESAFGGVLVTNNAIDENTASAINEIFFEVLIAPAFEEAALRILQSKKNRILLQLQTDPSKSPVQYKSILNGTLAQDFDKGNYADWNEVGGRNTSDAEKDELAFANIICKHLKSNAIALTKNKQLIGKGCGQTSRVDALRQAIEKSKQFSFDLKGAVLASDAFFPFSDSVQLAHENGIEAFIQPGGSMRDKESIEYCVKHQLAMVFTGLRHFRH
ncbi:MAG: bifunctional phosphoribosylaminoimidazolecarboxamide formyltransferase/IMP cyclohydrolase [Bacteroidetes bacterium]|nr:bifunctional phosphoribosylaminoimidazolecarboxamide formyltransferase/IMP cyclohydrolase [Bacteroidota bacterium]